MGTILYLLHLNSILIKLYPSKHDILWRRHLNANLENTDFSKANLTGTVFHEAIVKNIRLDSATVSDKDWLNNLLSNQGTESLSLYYQHAIYTVDNLTIDHWVILKNR